jgi:hypothetical protein
MAGRAARGGFSLDGRLGEATLPFPELPPLTHNQLRQVTLEAECWKGALIAGRDEVYGGFDRAIFFSP